MTGLLLLTRLYIYHVSFLLLVISSDVCLAPSPVSSNGCRVCVSLLVILIIVSVSRWTWIVTELSERRKGSLSLLIAVCLRQERERES